MVSSVIRQSIMYFILILLLLCTMGRDEKESIVINFGWQEDSRGD